MMTAGLALLPFRLCSVAFESVVMLSKDAYSFNNCILV